jgi:hypothetical protein
MFLENQYSRSRVGLNERLRSGNYAFSTIMTAPAHAVVIARQQPVALQTHKIVYLV